MSSTPLLIFTPLVLLSLGLAAPGNAKAPDTPLEIKYVGNNHHVSEAYYLALINAALEATRPSHGDFKISYTEEALSSERKHELLIAGTKVNIDRLVGFPAAKGPRLGLLQVNHPILDGFMGYRVLLIRGEQQQHFSKVKTLADLQQFTMGFGRGWEGHVYRHNQLAVTEAANMPQLLKMLAGNRYDFVPLSVIEIEDSYRVDGIAAHQLEIEQNLLLYMPLPVYFYVSPRVPELAERLTLGLKLLTENGVAQTIFVTHFGARLKRLGLAERRLIELHNPGDDGSLPRVDHRQLNLVAPQ